MMNNLNSQLQIIKTQIDSMKLQIANIEMQYINAPFQGEQLMNLGIQMFNTWLNSFTLGEDISMSSLDKCYIQLKNISEQINNIINLHNNSIQQMQMMMMQQNQMMQAQMMNQNNFNIQNNNEPEKMNLIFEIERPYPKSINLVFNFGTKIKDALETFAHRIGKNKNQFIFIFNAKLLDYNDDRKIEQVFVCSWVIMVQDKWNENNFFSIILIKKINNQNHNYYIFIFIFWNYILFFLIIILNFLTYL